MKKGENMKKFFCVLCGICLFYMGYAQEKEVKAVIQRHPQPPGQFRPSGQSRTL